MRFVPAAAAALLTLAGCSSYESNVMSENEYGQFQKTRVRGVPIVVTVPQKLGFLVTETTYEVTTPRSSPDGSTVLAPVVSRITETSIDRNPIPLGESKLVGLDIKRPIFGTATTAFTLENQYPKTINAAVDDKTLGRVLDSVDKIIQKQGIEGAGADVAQKRAIRQIQYLLVYDPVTRLFDRQQFFGT